MTLTKKQQGFTIVELLIVIVVIGILATLVIVTFTGIQKNARDTKRKTDINAIDSHLETYSAQNGRYPTLANMNDATWRSANVKGLDSAALQDPKGAAQTLAATAGANVYSYAVTPANCDNTSGNECTTFTLTATLESGGTFTKNNLN